MVGSGTLIFDLVLCKHCPAPVSESTAPAPCALALARFFRKVCAIVANSSIPSHPADVDDDANTITEDSSLEAGGAPEV